MDPFLAGGLIFVLLIVVMLLGVPIAFALAAVGGIGFLIVANPATMFIQLTVITFNWANSYIVAVFPLFIMMGYIIGETGIATDLFTAARLWVGRLPGGLAVATSYADAAFGATSGSSLAAVVLFTRIALPEMLKYGYDKRLAVGVICASGSFAMMIPPSGTMVFLGMVSGESIGQLLLAGFIPGVLTAIVYSLISIGWCMINPKLGPPMTDRPSLKEKIVSLGGVWPVIFLILLILGGLYLGWFTPTEGGAVGVFGAIVLALVRRKLTWDIFRRGTVSAAVTTSMLIMILVGGLLFSRLLVVVGFVPAMAELLVGLPIPPMAIIGVFMAMYVFLGMFLTPGAMIILTVPFVWPTIQAFGFNGIWMGILVVKMVEIAVETPPVGMSLYVAKAAAADIVDISLMDIIKFVLVYNIGDLIVTGLIMAFPIIALYIPQTMRGG